MDESRATHRRASNAGRHFADRLADAVRRSGNPVVVGLDPRYEQLPEGLQSRLDAAEPAGPGRGLPGRFAGA